MEFKSNSDVCKRSSQRICNTALSDSFIKCRCCSAFGKHQYKFGQAEIEMLMENLNLYLSTDPSLPHMWCSNCFAFLKEVQSFRRKALAIEEELLRAVSQEIKCEDSEQSLQNDPLEIDDVKSENSTELDSRLNTKNEKQIINVSVKEPVKIEPYTSNSGDKIIKVEGELKSQNKCKTQKNISKLRRLIVAPKNEKGSDLVPINNRGRSKGLELVPMSVKNIPHTSKGLYLIPVNSGLPKVENDEKLPSKVIKRKADGENQIVCKKKKHDTKLGKKKNDTEGDEKDKSESETDTVAHTEEELAVRAAMLSKLETDRHLLLKDNGKVRSNILLILENSTITPFHNNSRFVFKCFYCNNLYVPFKELKEHVEIEHRNVSFDDINKVVKSIQNLIVTADISCIKCRICNEKCDSIEDLIQHLCSEHNKVYHETERKPSHGILGVDLSTDAFQCHICKQGHTFFKNLLVHMNEHYGLFVCYVCGKKFLSERRYKSHITTSHTHKEIKCKECNRVFKTHSSLNGHEKRVHLKTRVKCLYCPETFSSGNYMKRLNHMAEAHGVAKPVFKCDICGKELANSGSVAHHKMYTHKQGKMHNCDLCGYMTCSSTAMKDHMIVHSGVKNHECEFCKKKFAKRGTLKLHLKIHLNDKRFACFLCDAAFIQKNSLRNHLKSRHPDADWDINKS